MWVFFKQGFVSVVRHREDPSKVLVRSRLFSHLEAVRDRYWDATEAEIICTPNADYRYRMVVDAGQWCDVLSNLADEIDYDNFKGAVPDGRYHDALVEVWRCMHDIQDPPGVP